MSWRDILSHNSHNMQKHPETKNCADIADIALRSSAPDDALLTENVADSCKGLDITPKMVIASMSPADIEDWRQGKISKDSFAGVVRLLAERRDMYKGKKPIDYTQQAICARCGPIWLWFSGEVLGCPWCWNRVAGKPIPRPPSHKIISK